MGLLCFISWSIWDFGGNAYIINKQTKETLHSNYIFEHWLPWHWVSLTISPYLHHSLCPFYTSPSLHPSSQSKEYLDLVYLCLVVDVGLFFMVLVPGIGVLNAAACRNVLDNNVLSRRNSFPSLVLKNFLTSDPSKIFRKN